MSQNCGLSGDSIQRVVQPTVNQDGKKAPGLKFGQPRVMALLLALTGFQHLIDGFRNKDLRQRVAEISARTPKVSTTDWSAALPRNQPPVAEIDRIRGGGCGGSASRMCSISTSRSLAGWV